MKDTKNDNYRIRKGFMKECINEYIEDCNSTTYDSVLILYNRHFKPYELLNEWYNQYLRKIDLKITPPQDETKHISLFDYKSSNYKVSNINSIDIQEFTKNNP
jgi:hypothetical protein